MVEPELYSELGEVMDEGMTPREALAITESMKALGVRSFTLPSGFSVVFAAPGVVKTDDGFVPDYMRIHEDGFA